ncbi:alpha/beta hydrolase [Formosa sp. PL04]|uniref:alpha/beta hydrolase n=1 Tax=Formosa sp. PL04 TaxID=3081755 RepID=UPI0029828FEB|nr:alpha/beta hydrolase-fold protein [Formosa sp. PL04]MDW5289922.1 alpha/beta hydrolase-fold protein [Formosa sp. PL04]
MKNILCYLFLGFLIMGCAKKSAINDPIPKHDNFTIDSKILEETRVINVWTPPNYSTKNDTFPVLYMPDGGIKEDFPHIANTLEKLIESSSIPPFILVGIENTERGRDLSGPSQEEADAEYCPLTDGAKNFRAFITDELMPQINKNYRVSNQKGIIGESLAGLFVMETFFIAPETFNFYIAMDPSLWWNNHYLEQQSAIYLDVFPEAQTKLWFAGSTAEDISVHTNNLAKTLVQHAPDNLTWTYSEEENEQHNTIFRATKEKALIWALKDTDEN